MGWVGLPEQNPLERRGPGVRGAVSPGKAMNFEDWAMMISKEVANIRQCYNGQDE